MSDSKLIELALAARDRAYAPYSGYHVGCALRTADGSIYSAANVENASYGLASCAERNAIIAAVLDGHRALDTVVVATTSDPPAAPCGMCLQTMNEFVQAPEGARVIMVNPSGERRELTLAELLPYGFRREQLTCDD